MGTHETLSHFSILPEKTIKFLVVFLQTIPLAVFSVPRKEDQRTKRGEKNMQAKGRRVDCNSKSEKVEHGGKRAKGTDNIGAKARRNFKKGTKEKKAGRAHELRNGDKR